MDSITLLEGVEELGLTISQKQFDQFDQYKDLLLAWNQHFNLTAVRDPRLIDARHFLDSLSCALATGDLNGKSMIDVGSGAGFPGLPLKIVYPDLQLVLLESVRKKAGFLKEVVKILGFTDVQVIVQRAEDLGRDPDHRECYDWSVARAVSRLPTLVEYLLPFCRIGGKMIAQKGGNVQGEITAAMDGISLLGGGEAKVITVELFNESRPAYLVVIKKVKATPDKYPRKAGIPTKRSL